MLAWESKVVRANGCLSNLEGVDFEAGFLFLEECEKMLLSLGVSNCVDWDWWPDEMTTPMPTAKAEAVFAPV